MAAKDAVDIAASNIRLRMTLPPDLAPAIASGWYSPSYGLRELCAVLDLETVEAAGRREYTFQLTRR